MIERDIIQLILDPLVRGETKDHLKSWMFTTRLDKLLFSVLMNKTFDGILPDPRAFKVMLAREHGVTEEDLARAEQIIVGYKPPASKREAISSIESFIRDKLFSNGLLSYINNDNSEDGNRLSSMKGIREAIDFSIYEDKPLDPSNLEDVLRAKRDDIPDNMEIIKSHFTLINKCSQYGGYKYGDLAMIVARPGGGKTTAAVNEGAAFIKQGLKVLAVYLGDMTEFDAVVKFMSALSPEPLHLNDVASSVEVYHPRFSDVLKNLRVEELPAATLSINQILAKCQTVHKEFPYDLLIIDYDSNIKETNEMLYKEGGVNYSSLKAHAREHKCVAIILCQPKQGYWENEIIPLSGAADSSKKQHAVDYMMTIGANSECRQVGTAYLPKVRRGTPEQQVKLRFDGAYGKIVEIEQIEYDRMVLEDSTRKSSRGNVGVDY